MADELVEAVARDRFAKKCLDVFNAGIVRRPDAKNPRGYTDYYSPYEAMMAVIALVREAERADIAKRFDHIRSDLNNIGRAIEDEGDRCYFGSTNDADELRRIADKFERWLLRHKRGEHTQESQP